MKRLQLAGLLAVLLIGTAACVQTTPLVSHAHIGHALTTWHDTPGKQGLFVVARQELDTAIRSSTLALQSHPDASAVRRHMGDTLHALNPDRQIAGPGLDYGAIRALTGALEHLEYAATSDDASANFVTSVVMLVDHGDQVISRMQEAEQLIATAGRSAEYEREQVVRIQSLLVAAKFGEPGDESIVSDAGLEALAATLDDMLQRETDPSYQPVSRKYVLGLVRLPNGVWAYRLPRRKREPASYGYGY